MAAKSIAFKPKPCPGEDVHLWVYHAACVAVDVGLPDEEAIQEIEQMMTRDPKPGEIEDALAAARGERRRSAPRWSPANPIVIAEIAKQGPTLRELVARSPQPIQFGGVSRSEEITDALFPENPWLCVGESDSVVY